MKKNVKIYALVNPLTRKVFYVGATTKDLNIRLKQHICQLKSPVHYKSDSYLKRKALLNKIISAGKLPRIRLLEECSFKNANERESFYFKKYEYSVLQIRTGKFKQQYTRPKYKGH